MRQGVPESAAYADVYVTRFPLVKVGGSAVMRSMSPGEMAAVISGLCGLTAALMRLRGRVALAREQRQAMAVVIGVARGSGRSVSAKQQLDGAQWSIDIGMDRTVAVDRTAGSEWSADSEEVQ